MRRIHVHSPKLARTLVLFSEQSVNAWALIESCPQITFFCEHPGFIDVDGQRVLAWGGPGRPIEEIAGEKWTPYNPGSNLSPAFPGYISGHSTFSRASATVLRLFTGSDYFGFSTLIPPNFGRVEPGIPAVPTIIRFRSFSDAAREAGQSRLIGGIHFADDNLVGQRTGRVIGRQALAKAQRYFDGYRDPPRAAAFDADEAPDDDED